MALQAKARYMDAQSVLWLIYTEQGEVDAARALEPQALLFVGRVDWHLYRQHAKTTARSIRSTELAKAEKMPYAVTCLHEYVGSEKYWRSDTELLREVASKQFEDYRLALSVVITIEGPRRTPFDITKELRDAGLWPKFHEIESMMLERGLTHFIHEKAFSVYPDDQIVPEDVQESPEVAVPALISILQSSVGDVPSPSPTSDATDTHLPDSPVLKKQLRGLYEWWNTLRKSRLIWTTDSADDGVSPPVSPPVTVSIAEVSTTMLATDRDLRMIPIGGLL